MSEVEPIHWIHINADKTGNVTACGKSMVYPMRGNGWRVGDITCPDCDRAIVDALHNRAALASMTLSPQDKEEGNG